MSTLSTSSSTLVQGDSNLAAPDQRTYLVSTTGWGGRAASGRTATVWLFLNPSGHGACWAIRGAHGFAHPLAVRIHRTADALGRSFVSLTSGSGFKSSGCTFVPASKLKAIEANPSAFYVAVRSADFPNGAVRGNL